MAVLKVKYINRKVISSLQFDQIQNRIKTIPYSHRTFQIALNPFSTVKSLNLQLLIANSFLFKFIYLLPTFPKLSTL